MIVITVVNILFGFIYLFIIVRVLLAFILRVMPEIRSPAWNNFLQLVYSVSEPILSVVRGFFPVVAFGGFDMSPLIALLSLRAINYFIVSILAMLLI